MNKSVNLFILIAGLLTPIAIILSIGAGVFNYFPGDLWFTRAIQSLAHPGLTTLLKGLSWIFDDWHAAILVIPVWLLVWWKAGFTESFLVPLAGLISLINNGLKMAIDRPRPAPELVNVMMPCHDSSFPSGHLFFTVMFVGILTYLLFNHVKRTPWRMITLVIAILIVLLIGFTRVYLGLHWASDVLGGTVYGGLFLCLLIGLAPTFKSKDISVKIV